MTKCYRQFEAMAKAGAGHTTIAEEYLSLIDSVIAFHLPIRMTSEDLTLVAGTGEYTTSDSLIARVWTARYLRSSATGDSYRLEHTDFTKLDLNDGDWRGADNAEPQMFYTTGSSAGALRVGLYPFPETSSAGGYPTVRLNVSKRAVLATGGSLPDMIQNDMLYVNGACWRYAEDHRKVEEANVYRQRFLRDLNEAREFFFARNAYDKQDIQHGTFPGSGVV